MVRAALRSLFRRVLELFFRRIEIQGIENVPPSGPTLFAINHPNALVDPLLVLCYAPRDVSFLAKEPIFRMPVIGSLARALDAIPVYRRQDQFDPAKNRETFARARALLDRGGTIAIAPEGTSHSAPSLKPFKTGAARIALGSGTALPVQIVPVGLFYTDKSTFRSAVLVCFAPPIPVTPAALGPDGEPPAERVAQVTQQLGAALAAQVVEADHLEVLEVAERTERIFGAALGGARARPLDQVRLTRQRLVAGYRTLQASDPALLDRLIRQVDRLEGAFRAAGLDAGRSAPEPIGAAGVLRASAWLLFRIGIFLPLALPGLILHLPAYWLIGRLSPRLAGINDDVIATIKIMAAAIFYPLTWIGTGIGVAHWLGPAVGVATGLVAPLAGYAAVRLVERFGRFLSGTRALGFSLLDRDRLGRLVAERDRLRADLEALAPTLGISLDR